MWRDRAVTWHIRGFINFENKDTIYIVRVTTILRANARHNVFLSINFVNFGLQQTKDYRKQFSQPTNKK